MSGGPRAVVQAPDVDTPRVGLLASALPPPDGEDDRWANGFTYDPDFCGDGYITDPCSPGADDRATDTVGTAIVWEPFVVGAAIECSAMSYRSGDWEARVLRACRSVTEFQVSQELWTGDQAKISGWANRFLADVANVDILTEDGATGLTHGLACLQQYLTETNHGRRGMIHATRQVITHWASLNLIRPEGARLVDWFGNVIVPGAGYDGSNPDGAAASDGDVWAYATGMVTVRTTEPEVSGDPVAQIDRDVNTLIVYAERLAAASWDGCAHGGVRLDVTVCDVGGS